MLTEGCKLECEKCAIHSCGPCHQLVKFEDACCQCVPIPYPENQKNPECVNGTVAPTGKCNDCYMEMMK